MSIEEIYIQAYYGNWDKAIEGYKKLNLSPQAFSDKLEVLHDMEWIVEGYEEDGENTPTNKIYEVFTLLGYYAQERS